MAHRVNNINKWKMKDFRLLPPKYKLLYQYIYDNAEVSGLWSVDLEMASFQIGLDYDDEEEIFEYLGASLVKVFDRTYWMPAVIVDGVGVSLKDLNPKNSFHRGIINQLTKYGGMESYNKLYQGILKARKNRDLEGPSKDPKRSKKDKNQMDAGLLTIAKDG